MSNSQEQSSKQTEKISPIFHNEKGPIAHDDAEFDSLELFSGKIYRKLHLQGTEEDDDILDAVLIDSSSFSPTLYLRLIHSDTSFEDLKKGVENLRIGLEKQEALMKGTLKANFDRFVNAKGTIDVVYDSLKKNIYSKQENGLLLVKKNIEGIRVRMKTMHDPIFELRLKELNIKKKLEKLKQNKNPK